MKIDFRAMSLHWTAPHNKTGEAPVRCFACLLRHTAVPAITQLIPA